MFGVKLGMGEFNKNLDSSAESYIQAIRSAGATVSSTQSDAINNFILAEKAASRWTSLSRFYLPVWAIAAANAIDIKTLQSGTFNGGVTHASGYIQGNGTTGYFRDLLDLVEMGHTSTSGMFGNLVTQASTASMAFMGIRDGVSDSLMDTTTAAIGCNLVGTGVSNGTYASAQQTGIFIGSRVGSSVFLRRRRTAGVTSVATATVAASGSPISGTNAEFCYLGRWNKGINTLQTPSDARVGCLFVGLGMDSTAADSFTLNVKTLWETVTGLTLA